MTNDQPRVNQAGFHLVQQYKVVALVPDERVDEVSAALVAEGADLALVDVLQGAAGAGILDFDGTGHGPWVHLARALQKLGTASNERENFATALAEGKSIVMVPVHGRDEVDAYARVLVAHGGHRVIHFGRFTTDLISY